MSTWWGVGRWSRVQWLICGEGMQAGAVGFSGRFCRNGGLTEGLFTSNGEVAGYPSAAGSNWWEPELVEWRNVNGGVASSKLLIPECSEPSIRCNISIILICVSSILIIRWCH